MNKIKQCIGIIYFTVCLVDGMGYVGFHHTSADDGYFGSGVYIKKAIIKHGEENFRRIIIDHYCTKEERTNKETHWIKKFNLLNKKIGYNITKGGEGGDTISNHPNRYLICENQSKRQKGSGNIMWNKDHKQKSKLLMSKKRIEYIKKNSDYGEKISKHFKNFWENNPTIKKETDQKRKLFWENNPDVKIDMIKKRNDFYKHNPEVLEKSKKRINSKPIEINSKNFESIRDASRILNVSRYKIKNRLKSDKYPNYKYLNGE